MAGQLKLHPKVAVMAAGNLESDNAIVEPMSTALMSRLGHIYMRVDVEQFKEWAYGDGNINPMVMAFLEWKPNLLYTFNENETFDTYAAPRTWEFVSRVMKGALKIDSLTRDMIKGLIGKAVGSEFSSFLNVYSELPDMSTIYQNPEGAPMPSRDRPDIQYALVTALAQKCLISNVSQTLTYAKRLPMEMQMIMAKMMFVNRSREHIMEIARHPEFVEWSRKTSKTINAA